MQTEVTETDGRIVFTHRLVEGACDSSYGIEVARIAGLPEAVIAEATRILSSHENAPALSAPKTLTPHVS
jgi:DNA mismatch repair protein MutS